MKQRIRQLLALNWRATIRLNWRYGGMSYLLRLPILVYGKLRITDLHGEIILPSHARFGTLIIGSRHETYTTSAGKSQLSLLGKWEVGGNIRIGTDCCIYIGKNGFLKTGDGCYIARDSQIHCFKYIELGHHVLCGELYATDSSAHTIYHNGVPQPMDGTIIVGSECYLGHRVMLLKGAHIPSGSVLGSGTVCSHDFTTEGKTNLLITGVPARVKAHGVKADCIIRHSS